MIAGMAMDQSTPHSFLYTSSLIKLASYSSSPPSHFSRIERHISQRLLFTAPLPDTDARHLSPIFTEKEHEREDR